jgi:hypothetical protein
MKNILSMFAMIITVVCVNQLCHADSKAPAKNPLSDPKGSIAHQVELIKTGDLEKFKACFTDRQSHKITKAMIDKAKKELASYTLDDLVHSVKLGEYQGKKTAKIKMKNGRTLTTLILTKGKWLADTLWFK